MKKALRYKILELCKTKTKKTSPDMFNFYVVLAGPNKVSDEGRATTCWLKFKAPSLKTKSSKNEGTFENMSFSKNPFEAFNEKKNKINF